MRALWLILALVCLTPCQAAAEAEPAPLSVDLAQDHVDITAGFTGASLTLFGVKEGQGDIAIVIRGPAKNMLVRRKEQILGIWMNGRSVKFKDVPAYYDYALSRPEEKLADEATLKENGIGLNALRFEGEKKRARSYQEALIRNKQAQGLFPLQAKRIKFISDKFFRASFYLPSNVPTGAYQIHTYLIDQGQISEKTTTNLRVMQAGMEARIYKFAHSQSLAYGFLCVLIAVLAGWTVNAVRRND